jgi:excisionase family DNA binding protein
VICGFCGILSQEANMTAEQHEPRGLLTVPQVARLLHISDDTVRRRIRGGILHAVKVGTTPKGRIQYRVRAAVVEEILGRSTPRLPSAADRLQAAFAVLTEEQQETLLRQAVEWARAQAPEVASGGRQPEPTRVEMTKRFPGLMRRTD